MKRSLALLSAVALGAIGGLALVSACADETTPASSTDASADAQTDARRPMPGEDASGSIDAGDAGPEASTCELTRAYTLACDVGSDAGDPLTCGSAKFDAWCEQSDTAINSDAFRRAEALCLTKKNCDGYDRRDCEYRSYATATPTAAQKQVVAAYCQTCEPTDPVGCAARKVDYDPNLGPKGTDDVFVAAWELNDALCNQIRAKCTGATLDAGTLDAGADAAPCLKAFGNCAGDIYVDSLPDCPP